MVFCIGLTGNIASGKSTVASLFKELGIEVFSADFFAKQLTAKGCMAYKKIVDHFGSRVLDDEKQLNRSELRTIIFSNPKERIWLENLLHPEIRTQLALRIKAARSPYCIAEIPLLNDKKPYPFIDRVLLVTSPIKLHLSRLMQRDNCSIAQAKLIFATQPSMAERLALADDVLENTGDLTTLEQKVKKLHQYYLHCKE